MNSNGILVVNKSKGITSRDVVNKVCKQLHTKSVGHIGTLDPLAEGVLVCLIGKYTKLSNILVNHDKEYIATFELGILTDTLDITGNVLKRCNKVITKEEIEDVLDKFICSYEQEVPIYSAVKVNGRKLYDYARSNEDVVLPKKNVTIYDLELLSCNDNLVKIRCNVSKGTYIRSLIRDIGYGLGSYATMTELVRTKLGDFSIDDSYSIDDINNNNYELLDIDSVLDIEVNNINDELEYKYISNGNVLNIKSNKYILFKYNDISVALYQPFNNKMKPLIMF